MTEIVLFDNIPHHRTMRGITRYFSHLVTALADHYGARLLLFSPRKYNLGRAQWRRIPRVPAVRGWRRAVTLCNDRYVSWATQRIAPPLSYAAYYSDYRPNTKEAYTIHDMMPELFPRYFPPTTQAMQTFLEHKKRCITQASLLLTVSERTRDDLLVQYPLTSGRVEAIYSGVDFNFWNNVQRQKISKPYLLYVGSRAGYKNFARLLDAYAVSSLRNDLEMVVISADSPFTTEETLHIAKLGIKDRVRLLTNVSDVELRQLYANAEAFVYPSEYEGFGLPILEAMAAETVVMTSASTVMEEVGGDAPLYVNPRSSTSMQHGLERIAQLTPTARQHRINIGRTRARGFSWERCQHNILHQFRQIVP